jgi:hypothetical protein
VQDEQIEQVFLQQKPNRIINPSTEEKEKRHNGIKSKPMKGRIIHRCTFKPLVLIMQKPPMTTT